MRELLSLQQRMNRLFEASLGRGEHGEHDEAGLPAGWSPPCDVRETDTAYVVELELPGLARGDVELDAGRHSLLVRGRRRSAWETRPERFHRLERRYGSFQRTFRFEHELAVPRLTAELRDGLLRVELPKARPRPGCEEGTR